MCMARVAMFALLPTLIGPDVIPTLRRCRTWVFLCFRVRLHRRAGANVLLALL